MAPTDEGNHLANSPVKWVARVLPALSKPQILTSVSPP